MIDESVGGFLARLTAKLNAAGIPYMVVGSFASSFHGVPRSSRDLDVVIDPDPTSLQRLLTDLPADEYYVDRETALDALRRRSQFNVIDMATAWKADLIVRRARPFSIEEMGRRIEGDLSGAHVFVSSAEDTLLFRDVHDHLVRINDMLEGFRDMLTSIQEAYLSVVSNRSNDIMRFLTLFSTVMLPLTVVTGIYGMNFDHMPELRSPHGYPMVLVAMLIIAGSMLLYFRHRGWLGRPPPVDEKGPSDEPADPAARRADRPRRSTSRRQAARP